MMHYDVGLIGLAVMGQNLVLNMIDHGYSVCVYNRSKDKLEQFVFHHRGPLLHGEDLIKNFIAKLKKPRKIILMIKAGSPVDDMIEQILPFLEKGDVIIDGGNSFYKDTEKRCTFLKSKGIHFLGCGISGGEEGARYGPSIMPGGDIQGWRYIQKIFLDISAKAQDGKACCEWIGEGGAGHYVKMVHNGIEYGDIQLICETYSLMKNLLHLSNEEMSQIFADWNTKELNSYLIEIASIVLNFKDKNGSYLLDNILDVAAQKGTGKWTVFSALDLNIPISLISESVFVRFLSNLKEERVKASEIFVNKGVSNDTIPADFITEIFYGLYAAKIMSYAQGFMLMKQASENFQWNLNYGNIALTWRAGCIIKSSFLDKIYKAFTANPKLSNLLMDGFFIKEIEKCLSSLRKVISKAALHGISLPCFSSALAFFDGFSTSVSSSNLIQALRDYFGAHTYERVDASRGKFFHTEWVN